MVGLVLKFRNNDKLYVSRGPGAVSWTAFVGIAVMGSVFAILGVECAAWKFVCVAGSFILALSTIGEWEDVVMDRNKKLATFTRCNWYDRLCSRVSLNHTRVLSLGSVIGVEVRDNAVVLVMGNVTAVSIGEDPDRRKLQTLREEVSSFLRLSRMEDVRQQDIGEEWWFEWWDSLDGYTEPSSPSLQHSGVKVLVQPGIPAEPAADHAFL